MVAAESQSSVQFINHLKQNLAEGMLVLDEPEMITFTTAGEWEAMSEALTYTQRLAGIGMLTASIGHEMNTPLSISAATCSNLQHEIEENNLSMEQLLKYVAMIEQNAWRAARIVEVLRNYSYDEETQTAVTDLNMIIED